MKIQEQSGRYITQAKAFDRYRQMVADEKIRVKNVELENQQLKDALLKKIVEAPVADLTQIEEKINCIQSEVSYVKKIYQKGKEKVKPKNKAERQADLKNRILKRAKIQK